ncbi:hypothetical protein GCM10022285_33140 [Streptomyces tunisiensis]|uniref:Uncharacterized protein n=1 Tax=Streptomyces tunisiensis TaxID=948699 RepID=A0ABP7YJL4_9ACTN
MAWLSGYRWLSPRYERGPRNYLAISESPLPCAATRRLIHLTTWDTVGCAACSGVI